MFIYGINPVTEAVRSSRTVDEVHVDPYKTGTRLLTLARQAKAAGITVTKTAHLDALCKSPDHQGVVARIDDLGIRPLAKVELDGAPLVMFDGIQDPHNFGAAMRVCECFGFRRIIYHRGNSSGITPASIRVSAGAIFHLQLYESNLNQAAKRLKREGIALVALTPDSDTSLYDADIPERYCLIIGAEGAGVRHVLMRLADLAISIPLQGNVESLNVSCALSAALSEFSRRRQMTGGHLPMQ